MGAQKSQCRIRDSIDDSFRVSWRGVLAWARALCQNEIKYGFDTLHDGSAVPCICTHRIIQI